MSNYVIYYFENSKLMRPVLTATEYRNLRNSERQKQMVDDVRKGDESQKRNLLQFNYSCIPGLNMKLKGCTVCSNSVGMDIDHIAKEKMTEVRERILQKKDELGLLMLELSARGEGYHLVFRRRPGLSQEENLQWASNLLDVEFDKGAKDITRVFFSTTASPDDLIYLHDDLFKNEPAKDVVTKRDAISETPATVPEVSTSVSSPAPTSASSSPFNGEGNGGEGLTLLYDGIPYKDIVRKYWELYNDGKEPCDGNRNVKTYELAMTLRSICDYDQTLMEKVVPNYWNDGEHGVNEWRTTIQNALKEPRKGMPYRLTQVLKALNDERKMRLIAGGQSANAEDKAKSGMITMPTRPENMPNFLSLVSSKVPMKLKAMVEESIWPALCAHLSGVTFKYIDGVIHEANICSPLIAPQSMGKGRVNEPIECLLADITKRDAENKLREKEWRRSNQGKGASKDRQPRPENILIQRLDDDLTPAALSQTLIDADNNGGKRVITKVDEIEMLNNVGSGRNDKVALYVRYGFDSAKFGQRRVGLDSVNGDFVVRWVWNASCTPKAARRFISKDWVANGSLSRLNVNAIIGSDDDDELPVIGDYDEQYQADIKPFMDRLTDARGLVECPQANLLAHAMLKEHKEIADLCDDKGYRVFSYRAVVIGWLKANMLYIANGYKWDDSIAEYVRYSVRRDMWLKMHFFGDLIDEEFAETSLPVRNVPQNMLSLLPQEFTYEQYLDVRRKQGKSGGDPKATLRVWKNRGYIVQDDVSQVWIKVGKSANAFSA